MSDDNFREQIGGNFPPLARSIAAEENFAANVTAFLEEEYREILRTVPELLEEASSVMTLEPGDVLLTGTPEGVGPVEPGQVVTAGLARHDGEDLVTVRFPVVSG